MEYFNPKQLLVEDQDQKGIILALMRQNNVKWPTLENDGWPVKIEIKSSAEEVLKTVSLSVIYKQSNLRSLGIIVDADHDFNSRWGMVKKFCKDRFNSVPDLCPKNGLILEKDNKRFGAWIMPDNSSDGMVENFCQKIIPIKQEKLWSFACETVINAKSLGANYRDAHCEKAKIHTWLAWQDTPGERMGTAIMKKLLDPKSESAAPFVQWFKKLYEL